MSNLTNDDCQVLSQIAARDIDLNYADPDLCDHVEYLVTYGLAYYDDDDVYITSAGRRVLADPAHSYTRKMIPYQDFQRDLQRQRIEAKKASQATPYQQREYLIGEAVSRVFGSIFRLIIVYLLGIFTPYHIRLRILAFLDELITPIIEFIESLR